MQKPIIDGITMVCAGLALYLAAHHLAIWIRNRRDRFSYWLSVCSFLLTWMLVSSTLVAHAGSFAQAKETDFFRALSVPLYALAWMHLCWTFKNRRPPLWTVLVVAGVFGTRLVLWWPTQLIVLDGLDAAGQLRWSGLSAALYVAGVVTAIGTVVWGVVGADVDSGERRILVVTALGVLVGGVLISPGMPISGAVQEILVRITVIVPVLGFHVMSLRRIVQRQAELRRQETFEAALAELGGVALTAEDPLDVFEVAVERVASVVPGSHVEVAESIAGALIVRAQAGQDLSGEVVERAGVKTVDGAWGQVMLRAPGSVVDEGVRRLLASVARVVGGVVDRRRAEDVIRRQALSDALTGLANRALLEDRLGRALERGRGTGSPVSVLLLDLDSFKDVNDALGHSFGDDLLVAVAARLRRLVGAGDTAARFGGDEFVVVSEDTEAVDDALGWGQRLVTALADPFEVDTRRLHVSCSAGIAVAAGGGADVGSLLRDADTAMYVAKQKDGPACVVFDEGLRSSTVQRLELGQLLADALAGDQLAVHYQPICDMASGEVVAIEALARWDHPLRGPVSPAAFIPIAEESGRIHEIGRFVLGEGLGVLAGLGVDQASWSLAVNVSARQLLDPALVELVVAALEEAGISPDRLTLELTESAVIEDTAAATDALHRLRAVGVGLVLDDFGTYYSSLRYLAALPLDGLKVDRSFVSRVDVSERDRLIVDATVALAHKLGLTVTAEGVETEAQLRVLRELGCDQVQGFLFARPAPIQALLARARVVGPSPALHP